MSDENCSSCCRTDCDMAGTNVEVGRSKSSQRTCANDSGVIRFSGGKKKEREERGGRER